MLRYLRLYLCFVSFSFQKAMQFRFDFFFRIIMDTFFYAVNIGLYYVVFQHTPSLAGWDYSQALVFVAGFLLIDAVHMTVFSTNLHFFPLLVNKGELDYYFLRPVSSMFFLSVREFSVNSLVNVFIAIGILVWALVNLSTPFGVFDLLLFLIALAFGLAVQFLLQLLVYMQVFWTHSADGASQVHYNMMKLSERPDRIFPKAMRYVLLTVMPYALIGSVPARIFFGEERGWLMLNLVGVTVALSLLLRFAWRRGLRDYSSASS